MTRRSGVRFLGNSDALYEEFTSMALGLGLDVRTDALPHPSQEVDEETSDRAQQGDTVSLNHLADSPTQKQRGGHQK